MVEEWSLWRGLIGGLMIGTAAVLFLFGTGRVAGISGILGGALNRSIGEARSDFPVNIVFLAGLVLGPLLVAALGAPVEAPIMQAGTVGLVIGGILVGFGTRFGGGCTSGHGVCGLARLSKRSLVATVTFMIVAALTVFVLRHGVGGGGV